MRVLVVLIAVVCWCNDAVYAQLSRSQIKRNNNRLSTYSGSIRNKFGTNNRYYSIGISFNTLNYFGDLAPAPTRLSTDIGLTKPAIGLTFGYRIGAWQTLQASFTYGGIQGSDAESADKNDGSNGIYRYQRNLSFRNRIKELSLVVVVDLFANKADYLSRSNWTPYVFAGIAVFHHNPQAQVPKTDLQGTPFPNAGEWVDLRPLGTEGQYSKLNKGDANHGISPYSLIQPAIPFGVGVRFRVADKLDVSSEFAMRYLFTDYLDDVSQNYVDLGALGDDELAKALSYRSNEVATGTYTYTSNYDGRNYSVLPGYGSEHKDNQRGNKDDRDIYTVFTLRVSYLLEIHHFRRPKFR
jgi:hypothetical protein